MRKLEKKALELAADILKEMDEDGSGEISLEEFSKWWKEYKQKKSKGMFRGLSANARSENEPHKKKQAAVASFLCASLACTGQEPPGSSTPAFVR